MYFALPEDCQNDLLNRSKSIVLKFPSDHTTSLRIINELAWLPCQ